VERKIDQPRHGLARRQLAEVEFAFERADLRISRFERGFVEFVLAAEIIVDELLVGAGALRDAVDAPAVQAFLAELRPRGGEDRRPRRFGIPLALRSALCRHWPDLPAPPRRPADVSRP